MLLLLFYRRCGVAGRSNGNYKPKKEWTKEEKLNQRNNHWVKSVFVNVNEEGVKSYHVLSAMH